MSFSTLRSDRFIFLASCLCIALVKLLLVSENEIRAVPNDSAVFVRHVLQGVGQLGAPPGYPLWLLCVKAFGVPQRIAIEIFYLFSSFCLALTLVQVCGRTLALVLFLFLALNPGTYHLFDSALSDPFYASLGLLALSLSILLFQNMARNSWRTWMLGVFLGCVLGFMGWTRSEGVLLVGWLVFFFIIALVFLWPNICARGDWHQFMCIAVISVASYIVVDNLPSAYHYLSKGVWTKTLASMPSHMRLLNNIARIDPEENAIKYVTISRKSRYLAYEVSPTLALLKAHIERSNNMYIEASHRVGLPLGEVGAGWIWHIFNDAALAVMPEPKTEKSLNDFWERANDEIELAFRDGRIKARFAWHPFLSAGVLAPLENVLKGMSFALDKALDFYPLEADKGYASDAFDKVCNRRASLVSSAERSKFKVHGWVFPSNSKNRILAVQAGLKKPGNSSIEWAELTRMERPDVNTAFSKELQAPVSSYGFSTELEGVLGSEIMLRYVSQYETVLEQSFSINKVEKLGKTNDGQLYKGLDQFDITHVSSGNEVRPAVQEALINSGIWRIAKWLLLFASVVGFIVSIIATLRGWFEKASEVGFVSAFVFSLISMRLFFYGLLNENAWEIEPRYMSPLFGFLIVALVCFIRQSIELASRVLERKSLLG